MSHTRVVLMFSFCSYFGRLANLHSGVLWGHALSVAAEIPSARYSERTDTAKAGTVRVDQVEMFHVRIRLRSGFETSY